ncbi:hypothetical protein EVAR_47737_1 [Eumeta japonica]|uniref:Histone-lysine N-methyltransferase SETMAR n=1 Tax=Eumeta variegata TaxID=151549 RepID=A0A4C1VUP2_EUMVA|nr:hypothetical protein EVAR_47737_1 [Eumeta japonica]
MLTPFDKQRRLRQNGILSTRRSYEATWEVIARSAVLQDNAFVHTARVSRQVPKDTGFSEIDHPPYSPDLAPATISFFQFKKGATLLSFFLNAFESLELASRPRSEVAYFFGTLFIGWVVPGVELRDSLHGVPPPQVLRASVPPIRTMTGGLLVWGAGEPSFTVFASIDVVPFAGNSAYVLGSEVFM